MRQYLLSVGVERKAEQKRDLQKNRHTEVARRIHSVVNLWRLVKLQFKL